MDADRIAVELIEKFVDLERDFKTMFFRAVQEANLLFNSLEDDRQFIFTTDI